MGEKGDLLIVEDEVMIAFSLEDMLETLGWRSVGIASRVPQALKLVDTTSPDVAILDVNLHGERSYPVADLLSARGIPFLFATGYGDVEHPDRYRSIPTLTKPYTEEALRAALEKLF